MAAPSPALSTHSNDGAGPAGSSAPSLHRADVQPKTLRGLNKPKCIQCGNVARSRCPYQSCKSCCSKAQNPCHIHVLKANATFPDKTATSNTPLFDQQATEVSPAGSSHRALSLRQLSNNFAQFNNLHVPLRSKKPLTRKDGIAINEWRFSKLKEYKDRNVEVENEAFDHYMQSVSLLEEVFSMKFTPEDTTGDGSPELNPNTSSMQDDVDMKIAGLKLKLRSNPTRTENFRKRLQQIVDQGLKKLKKCELNNGVSIPSGQNELDNSLKGVKSQWTERASALSDLIDKLNKARNEEDLKSCLEIKSQLYERPAVSSPLETKDIEVQTPKAELVVGKEPDCSSPKLFRTTEIDQETLNTIDAHFSSLEQIEDL